MLAPNQSYSPQEIPHSKPSVFATLILFMFFVPFIAEILTGSNPIEIFLNPAIFLTGMLLYGLQTAIIADLAARYHFNYRTIFLTGFIYTLFQEGIWGTFVLNKLVYTTLLWKVGYFNISYAFFILAFHSVITVSTSIIILRMLYPHRIAQPFLRIRHYCFIGIILFLVYASITYYNFSQKNLPPLHIWELQMLVIIGLIYLMVYIVKRTAQSTLPKIKETYVNTYKLLALGSTILFGMLPMVIGVVGTYNWVFVPNTPYPVLTTYDIIFQVLATGISILSLFVAWNLFKKMDTDHNLNNYKLYRIVRIFLLYWFILAFIWRTPISDVFVVIFLPILLYYLKKAAFLDVH
jgi:hypothetical protein